MKAKKIVRYRITVSVCFPQTHERKGEKTYFVEKIRLALMQSKYPKTIQVGAETPNGEMLLPKIHTCRNNVNLWEKRFEKIAKGEAVLELYYWSGKPYNSKTVTICQLGKDDGIGLQRMYFYGKNIEDPVVYTDEKSDDEEVDVNELSKNDGLSIGDFKEWFKNYDLSRTMCIIHFTKFRY